VSNLLQHSPHQQSQPTAAGVQDVQAQVPWRLSLQVVLDVQQIDLPAVPDSVLVLALDTCVFVGATVLSFM
jgi:hypothetical protein